MNPKIKAIFDPSSDRVFIIAEIGKNFIQTEAEKSTEEYIKNAKDLIKAASEAGADAVKFQTHNVEDEQYQVDIISPHFNNDRYNWVKRNDRATPLYFWETLKAYSDSLGLIFFTTPMSRGAAQKLKSLDFELWKVGSGDILDFVLLDYLAESKKPIILSSGMSTLEEVKLTVNFLKSKKADFALLHCVSKYPCPPEELNLGTIDYFKSQFDIPIGFSDHSLGYEPAVAATGLGAKIIEKHFSFSREFWGADHKVSMLPEEFKKMIDLIRQKTKIDPTNYGSQSKKLSEDEAIFRPIFRKTLVAAREIRPGEIIDKSLVYAMRPQQFLNGLPSERFVEVLDKKAKQEIKKFQPLNFDLLS